MWKLPPYVCGRGDVTGERARAVFLPPRPWWRTNRSGVLPAAAEGPDDPSALGTTQQILVAKEKHDNFLRDCRFFLLPLRLMRGGGLCPLTWISAPPQRPALRLCSLCHFSKCLKAANVNTSDNFSRLRRKAPVEKMMARPLLPSL